MSRNAVVFEDNDDIRGLIKNLLIEKGFHTQAYASPVEVMIDEPRQYPAGAGPDVIISDNRMPHVSGLEYVRGLHASGRLVSHVAMMSGDWRPDEIKEAKSMGCKVLMKPFALSDLEGWLDGIPLRDKILSE